MKIVWILLISVAGCLAAPDPSKVPDEIQLTPEAEKLLEELVEIAGDHDPNDNERARRTSGISKKFSLGSISSYDHEDKHEHHEHYHHPSLGEKVYNLWGLKKAILVSLVQAIKAVTGGVIAVKGHLIKGGGKLLEVSGKLVEHKGEAVKDLGKHIAYKALSKPIHIPHYSGYDHDHHYHHGYPSVSYPSHPSEHHHYYHSSSHYDFPHFHSKNSDSPTQSSFASDKKDKKTSLLEGLQAGLVLLKPIKDHEKTLSLSTVSPPVHGGPTATSFTTYITPQTAVSGSKDSFYKFTSSGIKDNGYYKFDPIVSSDYSSSISHAPSPSPTFYSQSVPATTFYDKPSISRSIDYSYYVPQY